MEAEKAKAEYACDACELKFNSLRALRAHVGKQHKVTGSPIPQFDGMENSEVENTFTFVSEFHVEDIEYTIKEIFPGEVETRLTSRVRIGGLRSADHLCTLQIKLPPDRKEFLWPTMTPSQAEVFKEIVMT